MPVPKKRQSSSKSLKNLLMTFFVTLFLFIIHTIFIIQHTSYQGNLLKKLVKYYFDANIAPYQKSILLFLIGYFIFCIIYSIKLLIEKCEKRSRAYGKGKL